MSFEFEAVGLVSSPYIEKFGVPRQPGLVSDGKGLIRLLPPYDQADAVDGLQACSHIWLQFVFHQNLETSWRPKVRPPRLGGNRSMGVFATRSPVRPNPIGLSVVALERIDVSDGVVLHISGMDLVDGTPILDIKPYVPYADIIEHARYDFAAEAPNLLCVEFEVSAQEFCQQWQGQWQQDLQQLLVQVLQQDPRPAYHKAKSSVQARRYGLSLKPVDGGPELNIDWQVDTLNGVGDVAVIRVLAISFC